MQIGRINGTDWRLVSQLYYTQSAVTVSIGKVMMHVKAIAGNTDTAGPRVFICIICAYIYI